MAKMTDSEYVVAQGQVMAVASLASLIDIDGLIEKLREAESLGPILHPSEYILRKRDLADMYALAMEVRDIKVIVENIRAIKEKSLATHLKR